MAFVIVIVYVLHVNRRLRLHSFGLDVVGDQQRPTAFYIIKLIKQIRKISLHFLVIYKYTSVNGFHMGNNYEASLRLRSYDEIWPTTN